MEFLYNFKGARGMVRIWGGDWNDCMNNAGLKGRGESIWLSIAWYRANKMLIELAKLTGKDEHVKAHTEMGEDLKARINEYGWDGKYYLYAIDDEDRKIGSHENEEGRMYLNPQVWAVFSGVADEVRLKTIIAEVDEYLDEDLGAVVSKPPYRHVNMDIGTMTTKPATAQENGGVYLHALAWKLAAEGMLHRPEKVERIIVRLAAVTLFVIGVYALIDLLQIQSTASANGFEALRLSQMNIRVPLALALGGMMFSAAFWPRVLQKLLDNKLMRFLSGISMNLYIWHQVLAAQMRIAWFPDTELLHTDRNLQSAYMLLCACVAILAAMAGTYGIEQPVTKWLNRIWNNRRNFHERSQNG